MAFTWTDKNIELMRTMAASNISSGRIADILGVTRNTVCGKAHRLGILLKSKPKIIGGGRKPRGARIRPSAPTSMLKSRQFDGAPLPEAENEPAMAPVRRRRCGKQYTLLTLPARCCKWPMGGSGKGMTFCGHAAPDSSWCADHKRRVWKIRKVSA